MSSIPSYIGSFAFMQFLARWPWESCTHAQQGWRNNEHNMSGIFCLLSLLFPSGPQSFLSDVAKVAARVRGGISNIGLPVHQDGERHGRRTSSSGPVWNFSHPPASCWSGASGNASASHPTPPLWSVSHLPNADHGPIPEDIEPVWWNRKPANLTETRGRSAEKPTGTSRRCGGTENQPI